MPERRASDGLRARENGEWAERKLAFLDFYGPPALDATARKQRRGYVDLFAGPGMNITADGREFEGSALRILPMHGARHESVRFTDAIFVNLDRQDHSALMTRVGQRVTSGRSGVPSERIHVFRGDANSAIPDILRRFHPLDYLLVFADIEAPRQWPWASVEALKAHGHRSIDLYMLFPLEMGITRMLGYDRVERERYGGRLTTFFGTDEWRAIVERRTTDAQRAACRRELLELYLGRLRRLWPNVESVMDVRIRGNQGLYRMLFASAHPAAAKISAWARGQTDRTDQYGLALGDR